MLIKFYLLKSWKEQWKGVFLIPILALVVAFMLTLTVALFPQLLTGSTFSAVERSADSLNHSLAPERSMIIGMVISQAPILTALFAALIGANIAIGIVDVEVRSGAIEVILSRGHTLKTTIYSFIATAMILSFLSTLVVVLGVSIASYCYLSHIGMADLFPWRIVVLPWFCMFIGVVLGVSIQLLFPGLSRVKAGTSGNITQILSILPALAILILFTYSYHAATSALVTWIIAIVYLCLGVILAAVTASGVKIGKILQH